VIAVGTHTRCGAWTRHGASALFFMREIALWLLIYPLYLLTREGVTGAPTAALRHAREVVDAERTLGMSVEHAIQQAVTSSPLLRGAFDEYYELAFYPLLAGVLIWLGLRHRDVYGATRRALIVALGIAAIGFLLFPTAPPRMLPALGIHDTVGMHGHDVGSFHGISYNPYAAMPSLHVGWSIIVALGVYRAVRRRLVRGLAIVHPLLMAAATIVTGNHYLLDCIAGAGVATVAIRAVGSPHTASAQAPARGRVRAPMRAT
jgi:membrane-associated phospholipid phosphatase